MPPLNNLLMGNNLPVYLDSVTYSLYAKWSQVIPTLTQPFLSYIATSTGTATQPLSSLQSKCMAECFRKSCTILGLFKIVNMLHVLLMNGLFPTAPTYPCTAVSVHLLDFYQALFKWSCDAVNAMASALNTFYIQRGFILLNKKNLGISEGSICRAIYKPTGSIKSDDTILPSSTYLCKTAPACFAGTFGADIHVALDGNFNHQHLWSVGECPNFYDPQYMLSKAEVDTISDRIKSLCKRPPKACQSIVPDEAVDECESSHTAGSGSNSKTNMDKFDDGGQMVLVCCHNIPLLLANIDMLGEQQKYAVALLEHLYDLLPPQAAVGALYDIGCVLDCSLQLYDMLPASITGCLMFATSAMHAYAHQWACQIVYNPEYGEGIEHLWSWLCKLIGITHASVRQRWIWLINHQASSIGLKLCNDLGVEGHATKVKDMLAECNVPVEELQLQWYLQKASQLSVCAHMLEHYVPAHLKKGLDMGFNLQGHLDTIDDAIQITHTTISKSSPSKESLHLVKSLQEPHEPLKTKLQGLDLEFVRTLLMACDLKINIQNDQAAGGHDQVLEPLPMQLAVLCDSSILMEDGEVPKWLEDVDLDWCAEEQHHPGLYTIEVALSMLSNSKIAVLLWQKWTSLLNLKSCWTNPLAASAQFEAHLSTAQTIVGILSSHHTCSPRANILQLPTCFETDTQDGNEGHNLIDDPVFPIPDSEAVILNDLLNDENGMDNQADNVNIDSHQCDITLICVSYLVLLCHCKLLAFIAILVPTFIFIMNSSNEHLNDICLNGIAATLHTFFDNPTSRQCALFTTFDLPMVHYNASDDDIWRRCCHTEYWSKDVWILPIHQTCPNLHWVLCCIFPHNHELLLFDSLSESSSWKHEIKEIMQLVNHLVALANKHSHPLHVATNKGWTAWPVAVHIMQSNGIDCRLWVLSTIVAVLHGFYVTDMVEQDMVPFRALLFRHLLALPPLVP
ncbi:hypothetical protein L208DRAFT_1423035 [Tricholoma matsutake]|nr:hypothetical protein L208DRAFT_1423035 [Tricholoma matsutake 945]